MLTMDQIEDIKSKQSLPRLDLGHAIATYIGKAKGIAYSLFTLKPNQIFWIRYLSHGEQKMVETYTVLNGTVDFEYENQFTQLKCGDMIDCSQYTELMSFYSKEGVDFLAEVSADFFEQDFHNTSIIQRDAERIQQVDGYTYDHCTRIKEYSVELWKRLGQPIETVSALRWGAYFHDIGKLSIPYAILNKKGPLTPFEWELMKKHTILGADIIRNHEVEWLRQSAFIVEQHHERFDGKGYPHGLKGDEISLEASIVAVVDAFDAMTTNRIYRPALSVSEAIEEMKRGCGTQFHPKVVDTFLELIQDGKFKWRI